MRHTGYQKLRMFRNDVFDPIKCSFSSFPVANLTENNYMYEIRLLILTGSHGCSKGIQVLP